MGSCAATRLAAMETSGTYAGRRMSVPRRTTSKPESRRRFSRSFIESQFWSGHGVFFPILSPSLSTGSQTKL